MGGCFKLCPHALLVWSPIYMRKRVWLWQRQETPCLSTPVLGLHARDVSCLHTWEQQKRRENMFPGQLTQILTIAYSYAERQTLGHPEDHPKIQTIRPTAVQKTRYTSGDHPCSMMRKQYLFSTCVS